MWSNKIYSYLLTVFSALGTLTNYTCFKYIKKTFDTKGNLFNVLAQDSLATFASSTLCLVTNLIRLIDEDILRNKLGCAFQFIGLYVPGYLGPVSSLMISLRRFVQLKYPTWIPHNSGFVNMAASMFMMLVSVYYLTYMFLNTFLDLKNFNFIEQCLGHTYSEEVHDQKVWLIFFFVQKMINDFNF